VLSIEKSVLVTPGRIVSLLPTIRTHYESGVVRELTSETLCAGYLRCPANVAELRQTEFVQPSRSQACAAQLTADHIAPITEYPLDTLNSKLIVDCCVGPTPLTQ